MNLKVPVWEKGRIEWVRSGGAKIGGSAHWNFFRLARIWIFGVNVHSV
jgi:hypothetical protein